MNRKLPAALMLAALMAAPTVGCSNGVAGKIDGERVGASNGFFIQYQETIQGTTYGAIIVYLTNVGNSCETYAGYLHDYDYTDDADTQAELWAEYFPDEFWVSQMTLIADPSDDLSDEDFDGTDIDDLLWGARDEEATAIFTHTLQTLDEDYWSGDGDEEDYQVSFLSDGGNLHVKKHVEDEKISGSFETTAVDHEDLDDQGDVTFSFNVSRCEDVEDELF